MLISTQCILREGTVIIEISIISEKGILRISILLDHDSQARARLNKCRTWKVCIATTKTKRDRRIIHFLVFLIACSEMFLQKVNQSSSSFLRTGFCENNLNVTIFTLQKVALIRIFCVLHIITADTLQYILCLNISIISKLDICPKFDASCSE